jgi:Predicted membrane protein
MIEAILAAMGLGLFNLIFVAVPVLIVAAIILTLFVAGFAMILSGIYWVLSPLLHLIIPQLELPQFVSSPESFWNIVVVMAGGIGLTAGGIILVVAMAYIAKWFYELMIKYLKLNLRIIKGRKRDL